MRENIKNLWSKTKEGYRKIALTTHLKITVCLLLIPMIMFFYLPFLGVSAELSLQGQALNNSKSVDLLSPYDEITGFSVFDMLRHKELPEYSIYGTKIGDFNVLGMNVYRLLTNPLPSYGIIDQVSNFINSDAVDILNNDDIKNMLMDNFGDIGSSISDVMDSLSLYIDDARNLVEGAKNISHSITLASDSVVNQVNHINKIKNIIEWAFYIIPVLAVIGTILLLVKKKPSMKSAVIFTILFALIALLGIGVIILNHIIAVKIDNELNYINNIISSALFTYVPGLSGVLALFGVSTNVVLGVYIHVGIGYYLLLILAALMAIISYFIVFYNRYMDKKALDTPARENQKIVSSKSHKESPAKKIEKAHTTESTPAAKKPARRKSSTTKESKSDDATNSQKPKTRSQRKPQEKTEHTESHEKI